ncbi:uncharacterized protein LOC111054714 [Nilaparvata lugens]|uniref:uncharacterized protein LOC111054714 n=1 Tax=Nilaparvata lugens TaxID=108931 RepID=UPI00193E1FD5|nr:uncharacterized protein LOC111054714 [Nilaparvata lugens]
MRSLLSSEHLNIHYREIQCLEIQYTVVRQRVTAQRNAAVGIGQREQRSSKRLENVFSSCPAVERYPVTSMDMNRIASLSPSHGHDFQPANKLIMVRKTEQRTFASGKEGETPKLKTVTRTTVQTFDGNNKVLRKVTLPKKDNDEGAENEWKASSTPRTPVKKTSGMSTPKKSSESLGGSLRMSRNGSKNGLDTPRLKERQQNATVGKLEEFHDECLQAHNEYRRLHGVPELRLDKKLCKYSQEWAEHLAKVKNTCHRPKSTYGENIFFFWSSNPRERVKGNDPVDNWYKEIEKHTFGVEPKTLKSGKNTSINSRLSCSVTYFLLLIHIGISDVKMKLFLIDVSTSRYLSAYFFISSGFDEEELKDEEELSDENFVHQALRLHNEFRARHSAPPLQLNAQLSAFAQDWAQTLARTRTFHHRPNNPYGENLFAMRSSDPVTAADACRSWYAESDKYHSSWYGQEPARLDAGHFTQMVWRESELLGIGKAVDESGQVIVVANYHPRGNVISRFGENVHKPRSKK